MTVKIIATFFITVALSLLVFLAAVAFTGRGKIEPFVDEGKIVQGSVSERTYIEVNGRKNGLIIRGKSATNPVMLFVSGGPGVPQYWMNDSLKKKYPNRIEGEFTVCWWDYRGEGLSYDKNISPEEITMEQLTEDAIIVCNYLKERFCVERVYLMAHSGGTMLGLNLALQRPEYFYCYFSMGQVVNLGYGRHEAGYFFMKGEFEKNGQKRKLRKLESMVEKQNGHIVLKKDCNEGDWEKILLAAGCATTRQMRSDGFGIFFPQMLSHCYTFSEKINYWKGKVLASKSPYSVTSKNVYDSIKAEIPIVFISGTYDYTTPITNVKELAKKIDAPQVEFLEYKNSAHSPLWEENEAVLNDMMRFVKKHRTNKSKN